MKKKRPHTTSKFRLTLLNENTLDTVYTSRFAKGKVISLAVLVVVFLFFVFYVLLFATPIRHLLPGYLDPKLKQQMLTDAFRLDSLSNEIDRQDVYIQVVKSLFSGEYAMDSTVNMDTLAAKQVALMEASQEELSYRKHYEESEKYNLTAIQHQIATEGVLFYTPLKGELVVHYDERHQHFGVDISSVPGKAVQSVLDGQVIFSGYTPDYAYVLVLQHNNDFVSVYRQLSSVLKKQGETVRAGEALAFVGNSHSQAEGSHLHFELWYKGTPLNPEDYILFQ